MSEWAFRAPAATRGRSWRPGLLQSTQTRRPFRIDVSSSLDRLPQAWIHLARHGASTPFQTLAWLLPWYRTIGAAQGATPLFVSVSDQRTAEPLMFFPLCIRREGWLSVIEFADLGVSDYNAPLVAKDFHPDERELAGVMRRLFRALPPADIVRFSKAPAIIGGRANPLIRHELLRPMSFRSWGVALPITRQEFDEGVLGATFRKELHRKRRRLQGRGKVEYVAASTASEARALFDALCVQRAARFTELGRKNILEDETFHSFYETVLLTSLQDGFASLSGLKVDGEIIATMFALRHNGERHLLMSTMQAGKWKSCSPGNVAIDSAITDMIERGETYMDFTIGDEAYKRDFAATPRTLYAGVRAQSMVGAAQAFSANFRAIVRNSLRAKEAA